MDLNRLDTLARSLATAGSRRRLLGVLTAGPLLANLLDLLGPEEAVAKERRRRRKGRHKRRKHKKQERRKDRRKAQEKRQDQRKPKPAPEPDPQPDPTCTPEAVSQTCANTCGSVTNNCQQLVECEPCCTTGLKSTEDLQAAIEGTDDHGILTLCPGRWMVPETLVIDKPLTIVGAGAGETFLDGGKKHRVIDIPADVEVTLEALTITNGLDAIEGGGIKNAGRLILIDAELTANEAGIDRYDGAGGAIFTDNYLMLRNTVVRHNTCQGLGGGIYIRTGALVLESGTSIEVNTALHGGGISMEGLAVVTLESGSRIVKNRASFGGGGLYGGATLTLKDGSSIEKNEADGWGGGIATYGGFVTLESGSRMDNNHTDGQGGGIYAYGPGKVTLELDSQMIANTAEEGGAIHNHYALLLGASEVVIKEGALICGNSDLQCSGEPVAGPGTCPSTADGKCP